MRQCNSAKETAYRELVKRVSADYRSRKTEDGQLKWCENCREINLWTYWQGRGHFDARILLAGQDWGSPKDEPVMRNVCDMNDGKPAEYMCGNECFSRTSHSQKKNMQSIAAFASRLHTRER